MQKLVQRIRNQKLIDKNCYWKLLRCSYEFSSSSLLLNSKRKIFSTTLLYCYIYFWSNDNDSFIHCLLHVEKTGESNYRCRKRRVKRDLRKHEQPKYAPEYVLLLFLYQATFHDLLDPIFQYSTSTLNGFLHLYFFVLTRIPIWIQAIQRLKIIDSWDCQWNPCCCSIYRLRPNNGHDDCRW